MSLTFVHAVTGRSIDVLEGTRNHRLVTEDDNWAPLKSEKSTTKPKGESNGSSSTGGRGNASRKVADKRGGSKG